jgi:hypothetical protein
MTVPHNGVPTCMEPFKDASRWVLWRLEERKGKLTKPPYRATDSSRPAKSNDPSTWATYAEAVAAAEVSNSGIGLMLSPADDDFRIVAFDLDDCRDPENGEAARWAQELIDEANSYTEITPSGTGFRIIGIGGTHKLHTTLPRPDGGHVEVFSQSNRYITISGDHVDGTPEDLNNIDDLILRHKKERDQPKQKTTSSTMVPQRSKVPTPRLRALVEDGDDKHGKRILEGDRSEQFHHAVGWLKDKGWSFDDIVAYLQQYPDGIAAKYKGRIEQEVQRSFDKCEAKQPERPVESSDLPRLYSFEELENRPLPMFMIEDILPMKGVAIIAGPSGAMKSFLMIYLTLMVASGTKLDTKNVRQAGVLYMINEGQGGFPLRIRAALTHHGIKMPTDFRIAETTPDLMREQSLEPFIKAVEALDYIPRLIVIDTFSKASIGGDDNNTSDMALAINTAEELARRFDALVVLIDHEGKDPKKGVRGAYSKYANAEMVGRVKKISDTVSLTTVKQKETEDNLHFDFKVNFAKVKDPKTGEVREVPALSYRPELSMPPRQQDFIVRDLELNGAIKRKELGDKFCETYGTDKRKSFNEQFRRLLKMGKIREEHGHVQLPE